MSSSEWASRPEPPAPGAVGWLLVDEDAVPAGDDWLGPHERVVLAGLRFPKRRREWRLGRWAAKRAAQAWLGPGEVEVRAADDGAPELWQGPRRLPLAISISHRSGHGLCAVSAAGGLLGCDIERVEPHSDAFVRDYFTHTERAYITVGDQVSGATSPAQTVAARALRTALLWSAKESALKALRTGLRRDTRSVVVTPAESGPGAEVWRPLQVDDRASGRVLRGYWLRVGGDVVTVVAEPCSGPPVALVLA
ncbi:4'-phosphopantetheinyl transferase family protein [Haliangium sp.]|uniref:4'-phosphopantetheinyl transferase family protein n=1 Tax=Haliangium sp. TaxID=2663208 RepID=UPI003D0DE197